MQAVLKSDEAFTLVELLVSIAIIGVLALLAVQGWSVYKEQASYHISELVMQQARTALEAGKINSEDFPSSLMTYEQLIAGQASGVTGEMLVPGLVLPEDFRVYITHDPTCAVDSCTETYIISRHCNSDRRVTFTRFYGLGEALVLNTAASSPCP